MKILCSLIVGILLSFSASADPPYNCSGGVFYGCETDLETWQAAVHNTCALACNVGFFFIDGCADNPDGSERILYALILCGVE